MEVSVHEASGLPVGALLSVRAGSTRRQAPVPLTEPLRFPSLPFNAKQFKVDVLQTLGSARLDINAQTEQESYTVGIDLVEGQKAMLGLTVREEPSLCGKRAFELKQVDRDHRECSPTSAVGDGLGTATDAKSDFGKVACDTREYARDHNIPNVVQEMLQYVLRERPKAPYAVMAAYLRRKALDMGEDAASVEEEFRPRPPAPSTREAVVAFGAPGSEGKQAAACFAVAPAPDGAAHPPDPEMMQLQAEHLALRSERAVLLRELAELDAAVLAGLS